MKYLIFCEMLYFEIFFILQNSCVQNLLLHTLFASTVRLNLVLENYVLTHLN